MSREPPVSGVVVTGGVASVEVRIDDLARTARVLADVSGDLRAVAAGAGTVLAGGRQGLSAVLDPAGAARATAAVLAAVAGPSGVAAAALAVDLRAGQLLLSAARYEAADRLHGELRDLRHWVQGTAAVLALPALAVVGSGWSAVTLATGGDPLQEAEDWLIDHPGAADEVSGSVPALVTGLTTTLLGPLALPADAALRATTGRTVRPRTLAESAALLALAYPAATADVERVATVPGGDAPTGLGALVAGLAATDAAARGPVQGTLVVRRLQARGPDGTPSVSFVVDVPGTKDWQPDPRSRPHVNDLASNLELVSGEPTVRVEAVREVLRQAGATPDDPVLLVGHSQGGLVAVRAAADLRDEHRITHVVTVGSPTARLEVPASVQVLSLENRQDLVPRLDAAPNPDRASHVTVVFDAPAATLAEEHAMSVYAAAAAALDGRDDPALRSWLSSADAFVLDDDERAWSERVTVTRSTFAVRNGSAP